MVVKSRRHTDLIESGSPNEDDFVTVFNAMGVPRRVRLSNLLVGITNTGRIEHGPTPPTDTAPNAFDVLFIDTVDGGIYFKVTNGTQWAQIGTLDVTSAIRTYQETLTTADITLPDSHWFYTVHALPTAARNVDMPDNPQDGMTAFVISDGAFPVTVRDESNSTIETINGVGTYQFTYDSQTSAWISHSYAGATGPQGPQGDTGIQGPQGDPGVDGQDGADGADGDQWQSGPGAPANLGSPNTWDTYYLDENDGAVYVNTAGSLTWTVTTNIKGATGTAGIDGDQWSTGSGAPDDLSTPNAYDTYYLDTDNGNVYSNISPAVTWTLISNLTGPQGPSGYSTITEASTSPITVTQYKHHVVIVDTTTIPIVVNLPLADIGDIVVIKDAGGLAGNAAANNISVLPYGGSSDKFELVSALGGNPVQADMTIDGASWTLVMTTGRIWRMI